MAQYLKETFENPRSRTNASARRPCLPETAKLEKTTTGSNGLYTKIHPSRDLLNQQLHEIFGLTDN